MQWQDVIKGGFLLVYICIPQMHHAQLCPKWRRHCHKLCPHQASSICNAILMTIYSFVHLRHSSHGFVRMQYFNY